MKKIFTFVLALLVAAFAFAQVPNLMNYQAVARNAQGQALANQAIKLRLTMQLGTGMPIPFYTETRSVTTNALGLFNVQVGSAGAQNVSGSISGTNWLDGNYRSLKVEIDVNNSGSFVEMGSQQLVSVPYALAAKEAETAKKLAGSFIGFHTVRKLSQILNYPDIYNSFATVLFDIDDVADNKTSFDSNNAYDITTGEFTVPETGFYFFNAHVNLIVTGSTQDRGALVFNSSTRGTLHYNSMGSTVQFLSGENQLNQTLVVHLTANEKISVQILKTNKTVPWTVTASKAYFQGYKIR
jgi:hypothetical protein